MALSWSAALFGLSVIVYALVLAVRGSTGAYPALVGGSLICLIAVVDLAQSWPGQKGLREQLRSADA